MSLLSLCTRALHRHPRPPSPSFLIIMAQGRSGSTCLLRMLNALPGAHIAGENRKALDPLRTFLDSFHSADHWRPRSDFCRHA